jgi:plasmid stabilization system protein ParE
MKLVVRTQSYQDDLEKVEARIAEDNAAAVLDMWFHIDDQVALLADPNFQRKPGRVKDTFELVSHANYIVILEEDAKTVTVLNVAHARQQWPSGPAQEQSVAVFDPKKHVDLD